MIVLDNLRKNTKKYNKVKCKNNYGNLQQMRVNHLPNYNKHMDKIQKRNKSSINFKLQKKQDVKL